MGFLNVERNGHIVTVTLDRPPVNAVDNETMVEIADVFNSFGDDREIRVAIFTASGDRAFMGGADLNSVGSRDRRASTPAKYITDPARIARDAMWAITDCPVPVIAAVNGAAIGAGVAFVACCDMIVAAEHATFGTLEINVGLLGASSHLSLMVGRHKAREMFFLGEKVSAAEMYRLGAVREVVPKEQLAATAFALAEQLAAKSPIALRLAKESMNRVEDLPLKEAYRTEQEYTSRLMQFDDSAEARDAFMNKREPEWKWR